MKELEQKREEGLILGDLSQGSEEDLIPLGGIHIKYESPEGEKWEFHTPGDEFVKGPTGEFAFPHSDSRPSLEMIKQFPGRHRCRACHDPFWSKKARDPFCDSCKRIIASLEEKLEKIRESSKNAEQFYGELEKTLVCPDCKWVSNRGRQKTKDLEEVKKDLADWATTAHVHFMRHIFWNRFPAFSYRRFAPKVEEFQYSAYYLMAALWGEPAANLVMRCLRAMSDKEELPLPFVTRLFIRQVFPRPDNK